MDNIVTLKPASQFLGEADLRSEILRRLADGPCQVAELAEIAGSSCVTLESMLNDLPRRGRVIDITATIELEVQP